MQAWLAGFGLAFGLILAIGAQNAFVLRQGLRREHVFWVVLACALSDAVLIVAGVAGFGWIAEAAPWLRPVMTWGGAAFLFAYGFLSFRRALGSAQSLEAARGGGARLRPTLLTCFALTWLNPHVYLDTLVLIGSVSTDYGPMRPAFGAGAVTASFTFFFSLGYGARLLAPVFAKPRSWRILDAGIGVVMWVIALSLVLS
ncbi:MAG: LysE/ArgO family amino acid transporter [Pseudomonadota bacterium]